MGWSTEAVVQLIAGDTIINATGEFIYSSTPANGNLIISLAPSSGTDQFGNPYLKGITVGKSTDAAQVNIIPVTAGGAAEITFPLNLITVSNTPNIAGGVSGFVGNLIMSGPASSTAGIKDWVQMAMFANSGAGSPAHVEFRYINNAQSPSIAAQYNGSTFQIQNLAIGGAQALPLTNVASQIVSLPSDTNTGSTWVSGERAFMNNSWVSNINLNFATIITALENAGIISS